MVVTLDRGVLSAWYFLPIWTSSLMDTVSSSAVRRIYVIKKYHKIWKFQGTKLVKN